MQNQITWAILAGLTLNLNVLSQDAVEQQKESPQAPVKQSVSRLLKLANLKGTTTQTDDSSVQTICFICLVNRSAEEIGDYGDKLVQKIDAYIAESDRCQLVKREMAIATLKECKLNLDDLNVPANQHVFAAAMARAEHPIDYLLFATVNDVDRRNKGKAEKCEHRLELELVNLKTDRANKVWENFHKGRLEEIK
jgi:hypothetical protein